MRRVSQILSRLGKTGKGTACSLRKLDLRGNPLTIGFYPPTVTGSGNPDRKKLKSQEQAVVRHEGTHRDLSDALAELGNDDQISHRATMGDEPKTERDIEVDDPYTLPACRSARGYEVLEASRSSHAPAPKSARAFALRWHKWLPPHPRRASPSARIGRRGL
ncbi:hypothetical protein HAV15_001913 [Penicillium sp. str. |nr:hypothetical protein HAV15_001913 [Penicillium sp. str. \